MSTSDKVVISERACTARDTVVVLSVCRSFIHSFVRSFVLTVSLLRCSVSVLSPSTRTWHENHAKLNECRVKVLSSRKSQEIFGFFIPMLKVPFLKSAF